MIRVIPALLGIAALVAGDADTELARYHDAVGRLDALHDEAVAKERTRTVGVLAAQARAALGRGDAAGAAQAWKLVLVFDPEHADARSFFQGLGRLDAVLAEVETIDPAALASEAQIRLQPAAQRPVSREVAVNAAPVPTGMIGPVKIGTSIQFAYLSGEWAPTERLARSSPDRDPRPAYRLVLCLPNGRPAVTVPTGTAGRPFTWTATQDYERLQLRILRADPGVGTVRYRLTVIPPTAGAVQQAGSR